MEIVSFPETATPGVHGGRRWGAGGLSTVVTGRQARGHGYGTGLVTAARDRMMLTPGEIDKRW